MEPRTLVLLGVGVALLPIAAVLLLLLPAFWPLLVLLGLVLVLVGVLWWYSDVDRRGAGGSPDDRLVTCPNCRAREDRGRDTCRFCGDPLPTDGS